MMTLGQAIARLQANGHTFLAAELEKGVDLSLKRIAGQQVETEPQTDDEATQSLDAWYSLRGYAFPPNAR